MSNQLSPTSEEIARRYAAIFTRTLPPQLDREDFLSEALLAAVRAERSFDPAKGKFTTWVKGKVWRSLIEHMRNEDHIGRRTRKGQRDDELPPHLRKAVSLEGLVFADDGDASLDAIRAFSVPSEIELDGTTEGLRAEEVHRWVNAIRPRCRDILVRIYFFEQTYKEIANDLGRSESRVCQLHRDALDLVRKRAVL